MKSVFLSFAVIVSLFTVSCKKESEVKPESPAAIKQISVEYHIISETSNVNASYLFPNAQGQLETTNTKITRSPYVISFQTNTGCFLSVQAANEIAANKRVTVQIYVDGAMVQESTSYSPSQQAIASGNY
jgi:hypothetical protein